MAASRPNVQVLAGTVMGAGTPTICDLPAAGKYFMLQKGQIGNLSNFAVTVGLLNGTAAAAGTLALLTLGSAGSTPFDFTSPGGLYSGAKIDQLGGLAMKYVGSSFGTAGTVVATVSIKDILA